MDCWLRIVEHSAVRERRTEYRVTRWATRDKRRKSWRVMRIEIDRPGCLRVGNTLFMHPELFAKLKTAGQAGITATGAKGGA